MTDEELTGRFDSIDQRFEQVDQRFEQVDQRFDAVDEQFALMKAFIREENLTTRRHFDIVAEAMKTEIKVIAEGHAALQDGATGLNARVDLMEARQDHLEDRQLAIEYRQGKREKE